MLWRRDTWMAALSLAALISAPTIGEDGGKPAVIALGGMEQVTPGSLLTARAGMQCAECPEGALMESEPCGDHTNDGCFMPDPQFEPINCGDTVCGTAYRDATNHDADWYEVVITEETPLVLTVVAEFPVCFGFARQYVPGVPGCDNFTGSLWPYAIREPCEQGTVATEGYMPPGTYYFVVTSPYDAPPFGCDDPNGYVAVFTPAPPECPANSQYAQNPYPPGCCWGAGVSDKGWSPQGYVRADRYSGLTKPVCGVRWWGFNLYFEPCEFYECLKDPDTYTITFYHDDGGVPGALACHYTGVVPSKVAVGVPGYGLTLYEYQAILEPCCDLNTGWVSIVGEATGQVCYLYWLFSPEGDGFSVFDEGEGYQFFEADLSFCLLGPGLEKTIEIEVIYEEQIEFIGGWVVTLIKNCVAFAHAAAWDPIGLFGVISGPWWGCPAAGSTGWVFSPQATHDAHASAFADKDDDGNVSLSSTCGVSWVPGQPGGAFAHQIAAAYDTWTVSYVVIVRKWIHIIIIIRLPDGDPPPVMERILVDSPQLGTLFEGWAGTDVEQGQLIARGDLDPSMFTYDPATNAWYMDETFMREVTLPGTPDYTFDLIEELNGVAGCCWCRGDLSSVVGQNCNDQVDFTDFTVFSMAWGMSQGQPGYDRCVDLDGSGAVDFTDFTIFSNLWLGDCQPW